MLSGSCVIEVPSVGYLAYGAGNAGALDYTGVGFRLAPREGVVVAWSSTDVTLVDLDTGRSTRIKAMNTTPVTGRRLVPTIGEDLWVLYGPYAPGEFRVEPRIAKMEIRLPPILANGRPVEVAPVRINDGPRLPTIVFIGH